MRDDIRYIICPDIHGRAFWKNIIHYVKNNKNIEVIFLGDYLDPYPTEGIDCEMGLDNFKEIIKFANEYTGRVHLLVGNHDLSYILDQDICRCRYNISIAREAKDLFYRNNYLFDCFYKVKENTTNKHVLFSHSVLTKGAYSDYSCIPYETVNYYIVQMNKIFKSILYDENDNIAFQKEFGRICARVPFSRGGYSEYGSFVWEDFSAYLENDSMWLDDMDVIVGHTQVIEPIRINNTAKGTCAYDLDCRANFILTNDDKIEFLEKDDREFKEFDAKQIKTNLKDRIL